MFNLIHTNNKFNLNFILNNKEENTVNDYLNNFWEFVDQTNEAKILPVYIIKSIISSSIFLRKVNGEMLFKDQLTTKLLIYFTLVFSSNNIIVHNPHLRSEIFDILLYFFLTSENEAQETSLRIKNLLKDQFVQDKLLSSVFKVFNDAERLGTASQFYEKFTVRHKVLMLVENIIKNQRAIYSIKFEEFTTKEPYEATKMINYLMSDTTYLNDECIERVSEIKRFQDLKDNQEEWNKLDQEQKQLEESKFSENDRLVRT
jgi:hypothetical protein